MKNIARTVLVVIALAVVSYAVFAADQMKTVEIIVADSDIAVSSAQNYPFTLYIGDNLAGITNPLKSLHFTVSGVYTGGGTLTFSIDGDGATTKTFTLPAVANETPFEIDYRDSSQKINPLSAGAFNYTLNFTPSGVMIYGLGIKMTETHRYAPPQCPDGQPANQKIKMTEMAVADSDIAVSSAQNYPFTLYIGDNLAGITNPLKSLHFTVSGVYTGGGTLTFSIDGDGATTKTFTLPAVANETPFEIDYRDSSQKINPLSAGAFNYTLNFTPSGVMIYGLGIKMTETHRYAPPACGGMPVLGDLTSAVFDSTGNADGAGYNSVLWKGTLGGPGADQGRVRFQFAASDNPAGPWTFTGGDTCAAGDWFDPGAPNTPIELKGSLCQTDWNNKRYFRYKIRICSNDCVAAGTYTPTVDDVVVSWAP